MLTFKELRKSMSKFLEEIELAIDRRAARRRNVLGGEQRRCHDGQQSEQQQTKGWTHGYLGNDRGQRSAAV